MIGNSWQTIQNTYRERIKRMPAWSLWLLPAITGLLLALAYPPYSWTALLWVALLPLFLFLSTIQRRRDALLGGILAGTLFFGIVLQWIIALYPLDWAGFFPGATAWTIVIASWLLAVETLALFVGLFALTTHFLFSRRHTILSFLAIAALWPLLEYARAWAFSVVVWGPGARLGPHWTFGWLANALATTPFVHLAPFIGSFGLSFLVVFVTLLFFRLLVHRTAALTTIILIAVIIIGGTLLGATRSLPEGRPLSVALVQNDFPPGAIAALEDITTIIQTQTALLTRLALRSPSPPDLIVLPEGRGISWGAEQGTVTTSALLETLFGPEHPTLLETLPVNNNGNLSLELFRTTPQKATTSVYRKHLLIPGGEYIPAAALFLLDILGRDDIVAIFRSKRSTQSSPALPRPTLTPNGSVGGFICSGVISPSLNRHVARAGAELFAISASYAVFDGNRALLKQTEATAILNAVTHQRYVVQAANRGSSYIIAPDGSIPFRSPSDQSGILQGTAAAVTLTTPATRMGNAPLLLFAGLFVLGIVRRRNNAV